MARPQKLPEGLYKRGKMYYADFRAGGRRVRMKLSRDLTVATQLMRQERARAERADRGWLDNDYPLKELQAKYVAYIKQALAPGTVERYERSLRAIMPALGAVKVAHLDAQAILSYRESRLAGGISPRTINHDTTVLNAMLNWGAAKHVRLIGSNPVKDLKPLPHLDPRQRRPLAREEIDRLLAASREPWRNIWYAFLTTGMRFKELRELRFSDLDWQNREIIVRAKVAKGRKERRIPMDDRLYAILQERLAGRETRRIGRGNGAKTEARVKALFTRDHVFTTTKCTPLRERNLIRVFQQCCKRAGIEVLTLDSQGKEVEHLDLHSFRVTFATDLIQAGVDPKTVQTLLGHATLDMTMRIYAKLRRGTTRQGIAKLSYGSGSEQPDHLVAMPAAVG
jgi:integrase